MYTPILKWAGEKTNRLKTNMIHMHMKPKGVGFVSLILLFLVLLLLVLTMLGFLFILNKFL